MKAFVLWAMLMITGAQSVATAAPADYAAVTPGQTLEFPRDFGSHPQFRTEWWYVTGWLTADGETLGFQVTFFRVKPQLDTANPSAFTPRQLLVAHCAISDPRRGRLWQDQRLRRAGLGLAEAKEADTDVWIDDWSLQHRNGSYRTAIAADEFALQLTLTETQSVLLNGQRGFSRKGPAAHAASYYYSQPQLKVSGNIMRAQRASTVSGVAWLDHEWSSEYLDPQAGGWDWTGINFDDGSALMAFRIRDLNGGTRWAGATLRDRSGGIRVFDPEDIVFDARRWWTSPRTGIRYPVAWHIRAGESEWELEPLLDDQENDTRLSTGSIYWEGAVRANARTASNGKGYLELTGYGEPLHLNR